MNALNKAHLLAAQILAHGLENKSIYDIKEGLALLELSKATAFAEHRYTQYGKTHISAKAKHPGWVAMVSGGRDCDGVVMNGHVSHVRADITSMLEAVEQLHADAEGPVWYRWAKPSEAAGVEPTSRDLVMEAFEDGHSHCLYA